MFRFCETDWELLLQMAEKYDTTPSYIIRTAVREVLLKEFGKKRFRKEAKLLGRVKDGLQVED